METLLVEAEVFQTDGRTEEQAWQS